MPPLYLRKGSFFVQKMGSTTLHRTVFREDSVGVVESYAFVMLEKIEMIGA